LLKEAKMGQEDLINEAKEFFETYKSEIGKFAKEGKKSVFLSFHDLASNSLNLAEKLITSPEETIQVLEVALEETGLMNNVHVRFIDMPKSQEIKIREIRAKHMGQMIAVEGIVRQASDVRPQVVNAKFECPSCGTIISVLQIDAHFREPSRCNCGRKGAFKLLSKDMVDAQRTVIEESPDMMTGGEQPRKIAIFLKEDLVEPRMEEKTTPGSRVLVIGVLKEVPIPLRTGAISTRFDLAIEANNVIPLEETFEELSITEEDERQIHELAADPKLYDKLRESISPSVYGYDEIKDALVLQLFGGIRRQRSDGNFNRGDLHVFLIGDPGVAKSVMLKFISKISPKGRYVSGKSATAAGLTATVIKDEFLKGWSLEAGTMVLANKGLCAVDELEDMAEEDRSSMHEAMEQQCYHHDTIITLTDGSERKIGELVEELMDRNKTEIIEGKDCLILPVKNLELFTTDWKNIHKTRAARVSKHKSFDKFVKIKFGNGREIIVTPEHPVFCAENGKIITKRADEINLGNDVPIPLLLPIEGERQKFNTDISRNSKQHIKIPQQNGEKIYKIAGFLLSEGSRELNRGKIIGINFTNKDNRVLDEFEKCMEAEFKLTPYKQVRMDEYGERYSYRYISIELTEFLKLNMPELLSLSDKKKIPKILMKGKKENIADMLSTLFEGDGYVSEKTRTIRIGYKTKSRCLAEQIQDLLLRFGIRSSITGDKEYFRVGITSYSNINKFISEIGFFTPEKNEIIKKYLKEKTIKRTVKYIIPGCFNESIIKIIKEEGIEKVKGYQAYNIIYDHLIRKDKFSFSTNFVRDLFPLVNKPENKEFLSMFVNDIGWEKVIGLEMIDNETEDWVYDITIEPNHAFVSQAAILHNTISISKANVHATLRAETSVLAAANPKFGRFDPYQSIQSQINIDPALLNRFDLIFILKDMPERIKDAAIASHVLLERQHVQETKIPIEPSFFRKYVAYAKRKIIPELTDKAIDEIKNFYVELRNMPTVSNDLIKPIPVTARQLEALVRLAEANAKARLSKKVTKEDAKKAIDLLKFCLQQVGFDYETKTFDIDKISTSGITASQKSKIIFVREAISRLESRFGKLIPMEELDKELEGKMEREIVEEVIDKLAMAGDVFKPKRGFIQRM
jgi:replicative DNA helicase Mcm